MTGSRLFGHDIVADYRQPFFGTVTCLTLLNLNKEFLQFDSPSTFEDDDISGTRHQMSGITKVWVRRPSSSPTRIQIPSSISTPICTPSADALSAMDGPRHVDVELTEDFLVDDLREAILKKYPQSLGKHHDAADLSIRIPLRRQNGGGNGDSEPGRLLSPDENVIKILREEYPDGQKSSEAWTIITTGGRDNYTRWWLQTGGLSIDTIPFRGVYSPNQYIPSAGGSFGSEGVHQEYFPFVPQTVVTPPSELPPRSKTSASSMLSGGQYVRSQGRPSLRSSRTPTQEGSFPGRRFDNTSASSMIVEVASGAESEVSRPQGRGSPDPNTLSGIRYPNIRPSSSTSNQSTPVTEYPNRLRQYAQGNKQSTPVPGQTFQMQLPLQIHPSIPQKAQSPLGGPPTYSQRLSQGGGTRPTISTMVSSSPTIQVEKPPIQPKDTTSPKSPGSGCSPNSAGTTSSPATRRKSNTLNSQSSNAPITRPRSPSPVGGRTDSPRPPRGLPLVKSKSEKDTAPPKNSTLGVIPPINVLIVEDNIINAQILEAFFRKRKLKYATAVNGKEAVEKWRQGGWHLVLVPSPFPHFMKCFNILDGHSTPCNVRNRSNERNSPFRTCQSYRHILRGIYR